jgi:undecaprenyl-diphosphatase
MKNFLIVLLGSLFLLSCTQRVPEDVVDNYIPPPQSVVDKQFNFHIVDENLWRSSQPNKESLIRMKEHGLKTIINLRGDEETDLWEKSLSDSLGISYFSKKMDSRFPQEMSYLQEILSIIEDTTNQPVLIHCLGGKDRTGLISAMYKFKYYNIPLEDLKKEMIMYGHDNENYPAIFEALDIFSKNSTPAK